MLLIVMVLSLPFSLCAMESGSASNQGISLYEVLSKNSSLKMIKDKQSTVAFLNNLSQQEKLYLRKSYSNLVNSKNTSTVLDMSDVLLEHTNLEKKNVLAELLVNASFFIDLKQKKELSGHLLDSLVGVAGNAMEPLATINTERYDHACKCIIDCDTLIMDRSSTYGTGSLVVWPLREQLNNGMPLAELGGHRGHCYAIAVTDKYIIEGGWANEILVWDKNHAAKLNDPVCKWKTNGIISQLLVYKNWLVAGGSGGVTIYDLVSLTEFSALNLSRNVCSLLIQNNTLYGATYQGGIYIWDLHSLKQVAILKPGYTSEYGYFNYMFFQVRISNDLLIASSCNEILIWDLPSISTNQKPKAILKSNVNTLWYLEVTNDCIIAGGKNGIIELWDIATINGKNAKPRAVLHAHTAYINKLWVSPEGLLFSSSLDGMVKVWSMQVAGDVTEPLALLPTETYFRSFQEKVDLWEHNSNGIVVTAFYVPYYKKLGVQLFNANDVLVTMAYDGGTLQTWDVTVFTKLKYFFSNNLTFLEKQLVLDLAGSHKKDTKVKLSKIQRAVATQLLSRIKKECNSDCAKAVKAFLLKQVDTDLGYSFF